MSRRVCGEYSQDVLKGKLWAGNAGMELSEFVVALVETCSSDEVLKGSLTEIQNVERLLVTANMLFRFLRTQDGKSIDKVTGALSTKASGRPRATTP